MTFTLGMDPLYFTLAYITVAYLTVSVVWILTTPLGMSIWTRDLKGALLSSCVQLTHLLSGLFFPLPLPFDIPMRSFGLTLVTVGAVVAVWAKLTMRENWGIPGIHDQGRQRELVTQGPFRYTRNPIYLGIIFMSFGMAVAMKSAFIFLVFVLYNYFYAKIEREESALASKFGSRYINYCSETPKFI